MCCPRAALTHGTLPWSAPSTRTTLFYKYTPRGEAWSTEEDFFSPAAVDHYPDVSARTLAILSPPPESYVQAKRAAMEEGLREGDLYARNTAANARTAKGARL